MKTVRFSQIVDAAGRPHAHTLWVAPERDAEFKRARAAHRVMTIAHSAGKTDAGIVGFAPEQGASEFLIFPKSLKRFAGARVVGVKFDLVAQPKLGVAKTGAWQGPPAKKRVAKKTKAAKVVPFPPPAKAAAPQVEPKPPPKEKPKPTTKAATPDAADLVREIRAALKELEAGKSVAAYRRLERVVS